MGISDWNDLGMVANLSVRSNGDLDDYDCDILIVCGTSNCSSIQVRQNKTYPLARNSRFSVSICAT